MTAAKVMSAPTAAAATAGAPEPRAPIVAAPENIYGHNKRLAWISSRLRRQDRAVELGCGTGYMVTLPLLADGFDLTGIDLDAPSIAYGRRLLDEAGFDGTRLRVQDLAGLEFRADVIVASEVLEHVPDAELPALLATIREHLVAGGLLIVTVPNGYGWFELESFLWWKLGVGWLLEHSGLAALVHACKRALLGAGYDAAYPSTLAHSPHVQRFTLRSIRRLLESQGFAVEAVTGSVLVAGPLANLLLTGFTAVMKLNGRLGDRFPRAAAAFYLAARPAGLGTRSKP